MIEIGREYSVAEIRNICLDQQRFDIVSIIDLSPPDKPFRSDGCSCCPELWNGVLLTQLCAEHDLSYWCGLPGDDEARFAADIRLVLKIATVSGDYTFARGVFAAVSAGGYEALPMPWRWGYGRTRP